MGGAHSAAPREVINELVADLRQDLQLKGGETIELCVRYSHPKRVRARAPGGIDLHPSTEYLDDAARRLGMEACKPPPPHTAGHQRAPGDTRHPLG